MRILVLYYQKYEKGLRQTINEHLYSFKRYSGEDCHYLNVAFGIPFYLAKIHFHLTIYHYTICGRKENLGQFRHLQKKWRLLRRLNGYKVAIPQDEYMHSDAMNNFFRDFGIRSVFTCLPESEWQKVYPKAESKLDYYLSVFPGYIDEEALHKIASFQSIDREVDIGYRARKLPYWIGRHGQLKVILGNKFLNRSVPHTLKLDISVAPDDVFFGDDWYRFLCRCRTVLGCEGGASLHDPTGEIRSKVENYVAQHPEASFDEVEQVCFPGLDGNLKLFSLSPRHFECAITKTCQVLVEGEYAGIFKPGIHYIEVKKDWSNLPEVFRLIEDRNYCEKIAENAYRDIVQSCQYTYRRFVENVINHVKKVNNFENIDKDSIMSQFFLYLLDQRERFAALFMAFSFLNVSMRKLVKRLFAATGLLEYFYRLRGY